MKESQAWREVASDIATRGLRHSCLCWTADALCEKGLFDDHTLSDMYSRASMHVLSTPGRCAFAYEPGTEKEARILAALWMALEAEEEGK